MRSFGYEIEDRYYARGRDLGFEIQGISGKLLQDFSQRSAQRNRAIAEFVRQNGRQPSDNEVAILVRESRVDKQVEISTDEVRRRQRARLTGEDERTLAQLRKAALACSETRAKELPTVAASLAYAQQHLFERVSVARVDELLAETLRHGRGHIGLGELKGHLVIQESAGTVLRAGHEVATRASLDREQEMVERINRGLGHFEPLGGHGDFIASDRLRPEQKQVVQFLLDSRDFAVDLRGAAGTGKTATLQELHRSLREAGRRAIAVAPTMSAVEELHKVGFSTAMSLETTAQRSDARNFHEGQILEFHRPVKGADKNEALEVVGVRGNKIVARNGHGEEHEFTSKQAKCFDVYERREIEVSPNDRLLLTANRRESGFRATNGELVTASRVDKEGRIHLQDGGCY